MSLATTVKRSLQLGQLGLDMVRARRAAAGPGREAAHRLIAARLGRLRGLPQKIGQIVSLAELESESPVFAHLTEAAPAVPASESFEWIAHELGALDTIFQSLDDQAAAASLGQVHRGELKDGRRVAVKVQYPFIRESLDADLAAMGWLTAPLSVSRSGFDLAAYRSELRRSLLAELDYGRELQSLRAAAARSADVPGLVTPVPIEAWCTPRVLTMTWVDGERVEHAADWPPAQREEAARIQLRFFLHGCFHWRELHADPHPGNVRFARDRGAVHVGVLDFGCVHTLDASVSRAIYELCVYCRDMSDNQLLAAYLAIGFNPLLLEPIACRLRAVTQILCEPFQTDAPYDMRAWAVSDRLSTALAEDRWNFRFAGPASLIFFIRAFQGLVRFAGLLDARLNWRQELLRLAASAGSGSDLAHLPSSTTSPSGAAMPATTPRLRIHVLRQGAAVASLTFPVTAVGHLPDLVPVEMLGRIQARGIDLPKLAARTSAAGCPAGDLFSLVEDDLSVKVWIE